MRRALVGVGVLLLWGLGARFAWSDALQLSNGRVLEGIVVRETATELDIQVAWKGMVTLDRRSVVSITNAGPPARRQLRDRWRKEFADAQARTQTRAAFEASQRAKGLVKYRGGWVTPEAVALVEAEQLKRERARHAEETQHLTQRLEALEASQALLERQLADQRRLWLSRPIVMLGRGPNRFKDQQRNIIRVRDRGGAPFLVTTDGTRLHLQVHDGHLAFTDAQGLHHDLTPAGP